MKEICMNSWDKLIQGDSNSLTPHIPIDVRSPIEYVDGHIPGAVNIPLFTNKEREQIGILYKKEGAEQAKWKAMEIVSPKIPELLKALKEYTTHGIQPIVYCWRGGSRSGAVTTFAQLAGLDVLRLTGGYRAYREWSLEQLNETLVLQKIPVLLHGMTGVGKTEILHKLQDQHPTLDLEKLANHRGSIFGQIGITECHNQKTFDSLLHGRLLSLKNAEYIVMEAESKRIGKVSQPNFLLEWRKSGIHFILNAPLSFRVEMILNEYVVPYAHEEWFQQKVRDAFDQIKKRLKLEDRVEADQFLKEQKYADFIQLMLDHYYDPRYQFHESNYTGRHIEIEYTNIDEAVEKINDALKNIDVANLHSAILA